MKLFVVLLALGALVAAGIAYSAAGPSAQLVHQDRVYGGGTIGPGCLVPDIGICIDDTRTFAIDAHADSHGRAAFGDVEYAGPTHYQDEQVTCLSVDGNKAAIGAIVTAADRPSVVGMWTLMFLTDGGNPTSVTLDSSSLQYFGPATPGPAGGWPPGFPNVCPSPNTGAPNLGLVPAYLALTGGDIVVQDSNP
jgi:hypothetical protein